MMSTPRSSNPNHVQPQALTPETALEQPFVYSRRLSLARITGGLFSAPLLTAAWASGVPLDPARSPWPEQQKWTFQIEGRANGFPYRAESSLALSLRSGRYQLSNETRIPLLGRQVQHSTGEWHETQGPTPHQFSDSKRKERNARFEPQQGQIVFTQSNLTVPWVPGVQDRISLLLALSHHQATRSPDLLKKKLRWRVPVISSHGVDIWLLECQGEHRIEVPAGSLLAWQWDRVDLPPGESALSLWFSAQTHAGPTRILMTQANGNRVDQRLSQ